MTMTTKGERRSESAEARERKVATKRRAKNAAASEKQKHRRGRSSAKPRKATLTKFRYRAVDASGAEQSGHEKAASAGALHFALLQRGMQPLEVRAARNPLAFEITQKKVPREEVMNFSRQMAVFMKAGIPIMEALEVIEDETQGKMMKAILLDMIESLRSGDTFATAARAHPEAFPNYYVGILASAELTGNLDEVLSQLAEYIDRDVKARSKITAALVYPSVVAVMSVVTILVLTIFVMPRFVVFFASLHAKLPFVTQLMLNASSFVSTYWYLIVSAMLFIGGTFMAMRRAPRGRARLDTWLLRLPVIGDITRTAILERICRILASLLRAGVDLPQSMSVTADSANNYVYRTALEDIREEMMQGQGLAGPLARTGLFPSAAKQMFRVGEETGTLDQQLDVAASYYGRELETKVDKATSLFEPAIIIVMGVVVGFVAVALISAMYGIYSQVKVG